MKNLLNNLLNWVLKKGPSETEKDQVSLRAISYAAVIFMVLMVGVGNAWGQGVSYVCGFENGTDSWGKSSMGTLASETTEVRTGSKSLKCPCSNANGYARKSVSYTKGYYIHLILWAKSSANTSATTKMNSTQGGTTDITTSGWTRMTQSYNYTSSTANKNTDVLPKMASGNFFIDDVIVYYSSSSTTDITKPSSATSASATTSSISWTCGSDAGTSVQATLIFHRTGGSVGGNDLTLNDQGLYSLTATEGPKVVGNWTLLSASVDAAATSYSGTFEAGHEYAIVHRDLAYNYSTPTYVTVAAAPACGETAQAALTLSPSSGTICGTGSTTFTVSGGSGTGALSVATSDPSKATASIDGSTVTVTGVAAGSATITVTKACDATYAEKTATYSATVAAIPTANAGVDKTTEPGNGVALAATAAASGCTGAWTIQSGPNNSTAQLSSTSSETATFTPTVAGTYTLRWTVTNSTSGCSAYDEMTVKAAICSISDCGNATLTYPIYTSGNLTTSNLFSGASSTNTTAVSVGSSPAFTGVTVSAAAKGSSASAGACYAKSTALTGKMQYSASSKSSSYYIDFPFTVNTGYTFTPCDVQVVIQPVSSNQAFTVEITNGTNVYGTSTATLNAGVMEPIIGLTSTAEMSAGNYAIRLYPHGGSSKEFRMGANVILKGTTAAATPSCTAPDHVDISGAWDKFGGETISLTATAYSSEGTGSPIADGNITGWQWQKLVGSTWTNMTNGTADGVTTSGATTKNLQISNCGQGNSGKYRCVVSTGATCSTASATATDGSEGYVVKVYALECYTGGTTVYNFTRDGNNQRGSVEVDLAARAEGHEFKIHADKYYGNDGTINFDENNWTFTAAGNNVTVNPGLGGTFTFTIDYSSNGDVPVLAVTYPRKRIYLVPNSDWLSNSAKFAYYYFHKTGDDTDAEGWTDFLTADDCGRYADIPQWNGVQMIAVRFNPSDATPGWNGDGHVWNQTSDLTVTSNDLITITGWNNSQTYNSTYSTPTYTIEYAKGSVPTGGGSISGSKSNETKTCGVAFTLPSSAVFTTTGYTQTGWTTSDGGAQEYALGGSYTDNEDKTFYPVWEATASLTALECNTLYTVQDMTAGECGTLSGTSCYSAGLSANSRFEVLGDPSKTDQAGGTPEQKTNTAQTIGGKSFSSFMYLKGNGLNGASEPANPTCRGVKFIVPSDGKLTIYYRYGDRSKLKKEGQTGVNVGATTGGYGADTHDVTAGTYYIYGASSGAVLAGVEYACCSTPAAPTAFANTAVTSTTATFSITDDADAASYDLYYASGSPSTPTDGTAATENVTTKTPTITGLTASTTYKIWVRAVCDASHKSAWVALGTTSFTTSTAETPIITWEMKLTDGQNWGLNGDPSTTDNTNITSISANNTHAAQLDGKTANGTMTAGCTTAQNGTARDNNIYVEFKFHVGCNKKLTPSKISLQVSNIGGSSDGNMTYDAILTDGTRTVSGSVTPASDGALTTLEFTNADASKYMQGDVTLRVYPYNNNGGNTGSGFRMGQYVKIFGEIANQATPAATITWNTQPANGRVGDPDFAYDVTCSDGSAVTVISANTTYATIVGGKLHYAAAGTTHLIASATDACGNTVTPVNSNDFTVSAAAATYSVAHSLTNVTATSGATGAGAATEGVAYEAVFAANTGYVLPSTITVTIGGSPATVGTGYTWNATTGAFQVPAEQVTGAIVVTITAAAAPSTKDIYYGHVKITDGALVREIPSGATQFFTNIGGTVANNTEISLSSTPSTTGMYYNSNNLTDAELSKSSNWGTSSGSNRYIRGLKFANGATYTLALGGKVASSIKFYGWCGSESRTMTVGGEEYVSSATKNKFGTNTFTKSGGFTGNVSITEDGDFYGILVITIQTATPCTTPVIPALSNQSLCEGTDIAEWDATQTAVLADGETASYSWKKKGNDTELANTATFDLGSSATESQAGTYVVTVTVSKAGKASATATKEVTLTVNEATEVTAITADKATVYPTNSVTLTATANMDATWQWYTCTNAEGAGESSIGGATSASYTIASAGAAGTYYYKAVATGSCGTGSMVYTLTVSAAAGGDCFHFVSVIPASDFNASSGASLVTPTHATTLEGGTMTVGSQQVTFTKDYGLKMEGTKTVSITLDAALEAGYVVIVKGTSATKGYGITINGVNFYDADNKTFDVSYTVLADDDLVGKTSLNVTKYSGSSYLQEIKITGCGASCTDPEVTASANNTTACAGSSVTFTATDAHAEATYQWQKLDGTWTNISGATASTYNIPSVVAGDAGKYRVIASHVCNRTSNEVTLSVPSAPDFGSTVPASVSVMQTIALSINTVEATDAVKYRWYKSADATWDAGDVEIGTNKELIKAYDGEATGTPSYYIFCRAQNACDITTSTAIAVNVTAYVEEDCATRGNEGDAAFSFENSGCGQGTYESTACWTMNSNSKILVYYPPTGKYFKTAKVTIASSSENKASYNWSANGGTSYTGVAITGLTTTLTEKTIDLSAHGNVNAFQIGRNFDSKGSSGGTLYVSKICFEYTDACTATTVTPSTSSVNYEMGGAWDNPTFTLGPVAVSGETLTYSSSNEDIASVDDDGTVTFNGEAGTVTITASYAGGAIALTEYCASSGSYTINVSCPGGAPKVVAASSVNMSGCNSSVTLNAKTQAGADFADGTYQWFRNGEEIDGATSSSYDATQAGTYTVERTNTSGCTTPSTNSAIVTSETTEPEVERLVPFQYYHVNKTYSEQMKMRHLFAVKNSGKLDGKSFKMYVSRNGSAATDVTGSNALVVWPNGDGHVDTVMVDLNKLSGKYSEDDELVFTCKAIDCEGNVSEVYKNTITMNVIGATPTLALICSGSSKAGGTRKTGELTVGGDFLTGYNVADLCQQTGNTSFDANIEWGLYTDLKTQYIVTPVNGYAVFNKLNYEPFDILLLTDYPKASKSDAAATILDDMAALCDYRPMLSFKTHMVAKSPSKWAAKGFTTSPVVTKADGRLNLNIVCYAHPMFDGLKSGEDVYEDANNTSAPLVYTMLSGTGYESSKGMQGFELAAAENFVTIGLTHYNGTIAKDSPETGEAEWTPGAEDRMLVTAAERQTNIEARFILFSLNCGAQSKLTDRGEQVVLACLDYLLKTDPLEVADCSFTFDNGASNEHDAAWYSEHCNTCTGTKGDGKWTTAANWGPHYHLLPGEFTSVRIKKPVEVNDEHAHVMEVRIIDEGRIDIPAGKALDVKSTIRRQDGSEIYPTDVNDIHIGSGASGNGTLIFNNNSEDTKARVDMYSTALADVANMSAATSTWQYIGTPHTDVANARSNYYGSWLYQYVGGTWTVIPNGGPLVAFRGYCITNETAPIVYDMAGTLVATTTQDIAIPAGYTVIANSWTAPIDISTFTDDDMENISDKTIYFFNTGSDAEGTAGTGTEAGTYVAVPKNSASYVGTWQIPSMQGFYISTTSAGTLHLDYDRHVRPAGDRSTIVSNPMYAPRRAAAESDEPNVLKIFARGSRYQDKLVVLEREDFTRGYDSGWDGEAWGGGILSPMVYVTGEGREDAVSAIPEFEGTVVAFKAGEDSEYRFEFIYDGDESLYLFDTENNTYTQIMTGNAYYFTTSDKSPHSRFMLTRQAPQVPTDIGNGEASGGARAKKFILNDKMYIMINGLLYDATGKLVK